MTSRDPNGNQAAGHHGFIPSSAEDMLRQRVKVEIRKRMRGLRGTLPASARAERSRRIVERLETCEPMTRAKSVALFWPMENRNEVDLRAMVPRLRDAGVKIALPALGPDDASIHLKLLGDGPLLETPLGFLEPGPECPPAERVDVIVVPALAVDPRGHRLGYGAGYYDRLLPLVKARGTAAVAVAFDFQLVAEVPDMPWDVPVSWVVTDARTLPCVD